ARSNSLDRRKQVRAPKPPKPRKSTCAIRSNSLDPKQQARTPILRKLRNLICEIRSSSLVVKQPVQTPRPERLRKSTWVVKGRRRAIMLQRGTCVPRKSRLLRPEKRQAPKARLLLDRL